MTIPWYKSRVRDSLIYSLWYRTENTQCTQYHYCKHYGFYSIDNDYTTYRFMVNKQILTDNDLKNCYFTRGKHTSRLRASLLYANWGMVSPPYIIVWSFPNKKDNTP